METYTDTYGNHWSTDSCLTFGPYGGGGSVACANLRWIERQRNISVMPSQRVRLCGKHISFGHYDDDFSESKFAARKRTPIYNKEIDSVQAQRDSEYQRRYIGNKRG